MFGWEVKFFAWPGECYHLKPVNCGVALPASGIGGESRSDSDDSNRKVGGIPGRSERRSRDAGNVCVAVYTLSLNAHRMHVPVLTCQRNEETDHESDSQDACRQHGHDDDCWIRDCLQVNHCDSSLVHYHWMVLDIKFV
jgi:hypothetical protein